MFKVKKSLQELLKVTFICIKCKYKKVLHRKCLTFNHTSTDCCIVVQNFVQYNVYGHSAKVRRIIQSLGQILYCINVRICASPASLSFYPPLTYLSDLLKLLYTE